MIYEKNKDLKRASPEVTRSVSHTVYTDGQQIVPCMFNVSFLAQQDQSVFEVQKLGESKIPFHASTELPLLL
jgi:hypothetical protein